MDPGVLDDLCWQFRPAEPPGDAVRADHGVPGHAADAGGQHGRGAAAEVTQHAAEHRVARRYPGDVSAADGAIIGTTKIVGHGLIGAVMEEHRLARRCRARLHDTSPVTR